MKFARIVFAIAGVYGLLVLTPLYFMFDLIGRQDPPAITHPAFYYGFAGLGVAWQIAFLIIARDPVKYRLMMLPSMVEKFTYGIAVIALFLQKRISSGDLAISILDLLWGVLFITAFFRTAASKA